MKLDRKDRFRIAEQAALQLIRSNESSADETRTEFLDWSRLSAHHVHELLFVQAASKALEEMDPEKAIDVDALPTLPELVPSDEERALFSEAAGLEAHSTNMHARSSRRGRSQRRWAIGLAAACAAITFGALLLRPALNDARDTYATQVGEQRSIKLDDGSIMTLNTGSRARVLFSAEAREVQLLRGEALFTVQHDTRRPFQVFTNAATIVAVGTQFNVYEREGATRVAVVEGVVRISAKQAASGSASTARLVAGDEAVIASGQVAKAAKPDIRQAVAWRTRQLVFRDTALGLVAEEFNRYNERRIRIEDAALRARSISGVFEADDARPLIDFLAGDLSLAVESRADVILIRPRFK